MLAPHDPDTIPALPGRIADCFADVPRPSDITKSVARALDDDWLVKEQRRTILRQQDSEGHWTDLTDANIEKYSDIFPFLDTEGFRFYLPAFMSYALRRHHNSHSMAFDSAIHGCGSFPERFALFTAAQMRCTLDFLTFWAAYEQSSTAEWAAQAVDYIERNVMPP